ncbi:MAG: hypothetical protein EBR59_02170 [Methylococcaceae bacterium]|nr:hypothetical protein [Methylococcaceae bacterium]
MAIYDTEEEQLEQLKKWWASNNTALIAGVFGAIILVASFNAWQGYKLEQRSQASDLYQNLLDASASGNLESAETLAGKLSSQYDTTVYSHYAALELAKIKVTKGDIDAAKAIFEKEIRNADIELQHLSRLRLIQLLLETKQYEQGLKLIAEVDPSKAEGFSANYDELQGDLYLGLERYDEARNAYQSAIRSGQATPLVQFKLDDLTTSALIKP